MRSLTVDKMGGDHPTLLAGVGSDGRTWEHHAPPGARITILNQGRWAARVDGEDIKPYALDENGKPQELPDGGF